MKLCVFGTRPEEIKLYPFSKYGYEFLQVNQSKDLHQGLVVPKYMCDESSLSDAINDINPEIVLVQGDTRTAFRASVAAFESKIPVVHVEAGLRTYDLSQPFPEEGYRQMIDRISTRRFCSRPQAVDNLISEGLSGEFVGQTGIDTLYEFCGDVTEGDYLIVTVHRSENLENIDTIIKQIKSAKKEIKVKIFAHPNKVGQELKKHFKCLPPMEYKDFARLLSGSYGVLTDSGGLQEEALALGKICIVLRDKTERGREDMYVKGATEKIVNLLEEQ